MCLRIRPRIPQDASGNRAPPMSQIGFDLPLPCALNRKLYGAWNLVLNAVGYFVKGVQSTTDGGASIVDKEMQGMRNTETVYSVCFWKRHLKDSHR